MACLLALLRQMSDRHYQKLLQAFSKDNLRVSCFSLLQPSLMTFDLTAPPLPLPGLSAADLHRVQDPDPAGDVPQRLDGHAAGHQQVRVGGAALLSSL